MYDTQTRPTGKRIKDNVPILKLKKSGETLQRILQFKLKLIKNILLATHVDIQQAEARVSQHQGRHFLQYIPEIERKLHRKRDVATELQKQVAKETIAKKLRFQWITCSNYSCLFSAPCFE